MLDPTEVLAGLITPELIIYLEKCMSMGTPPSSGYAQRLNTELGEAYERDCTAELLPALQARAASRPALREYIDTRLRMGEQSGRLQLKLAACVRRVLLAA